jgi:PEP-CTERM motif
MKTALCAAALAAAPLVGMSPLLGGSSALAAACATGAVSVYEAAGFSCSVGPVTFSNIAVTIPAGIVALGDFAPFTIGGENGLTLSYSANTGNLPNSPADVQWAYSVSGTPSLEDAFASFAGTTTGTGSASVSETLSNGTTLSLTGPGSTTAMFAPIPPLAVLTDQNDFSGPAGSASSNLLQNAFSVTPPAVPEPSTWAMGLIGFGLLGLLGYRKTRSALA